MTVHRKRCPARQDGECDCEPMSVEPILRVAYDREEAAAALGMKLDSFERWVQPEIKMIRLGKKRLVPVAELQRWATEAAERTL